MEERNYKLYVHISPSNKRYYGITCQRVEDRWSNGNGYKYNEHFTRAINKYGWENFEHIVLFDNLTINEANLMEQMYITLYDTANPKYGYNNNYGGGSGIPNEQTRYKMSISGKIGQNRPDVKKRKSERTKGEKNPMYGKRGAQNPKSKSILMLDFNGNIVKKFECIQQANKYLGKDKGHSIISRVCIHGGTAYNYIWLFEKDYINLIKEDKFNEWYLNVKNKYIDRCVVYNKSKVQNNSKVVYQLNKDTLKIIHKFNSIAEASQFTNISQQSICRVCRHGCNTAGGFSWIYQDEYNNLNEKELKELYKHHYKPVPKSCRVKQKIPVICLTTLQVFAGAVDAVEYFNLCKGTHIQDACKGKRKTAGKHPITNEPLKWMYYEDYIKEQEELAL